MHCNETMRRILHIDMDAFFAAVEQKRAPDLIGKPVVIGGNGDPTQRGVVSTASYEARTHGIHSAMPLRTAHKLCPHAVFLPVDMKTYSNVSSKVMKILRKITPVIEKVSIDEAFLDISHASDPPEDITKNIKDRIRKETGLTCSIGIAPNKLLAKIASDMKKPDGLTVIGENDIERVIWPLPARKLWGIGPKTEESLKEMGIRTIGELAAVPRETLRQRFGPSHGEYLYHASRGVDDSPLMTHWEPKTMSREITFQRDVRNWQTIAKTLAGLTRNVTTEMRQDGYETRTVTLKMRFEDFETLTRSHTLSHPTDSLEEIRKTAFSCLKRIKIVKRVRLIGVRLGNLSRAEQGDS